MTATTSNQAGGSSRARSRALGVALLSLLSFAVLSTALLGFEVFPQELAFDFSQIALECNSKRLFPYVSVWPGYFGVVIPGTGIGAGAFVRQMR